MLFLLFITIVPLPTHRFTILHKVISAGGSFRLCETMFRFSLRFSSFRCLAAYSPSYVNSSAEGVPFSQYLDTHAWVQPERNMECEQWNTKGAGRRRRRMDTGGQITMERHAIHWERWGAGDRGREGADTKLTEENIIILMHRQIPTTELELLPLYVFLLLFLLLWLEMLRFQHLFVILQH